MFKTLGIDLSIQSTGICENGTKFHLIVSDNLYSKKTIESLKNTTFKHFKFYFYEHSHIKDHKEFNKSLNTYHIYKHLETIFKTIYKNKDKETQVYMEGIAMGATGTIDQLSGINYLTRILLFNRGLPFDNLHIISPTTLKKHSVGKGDVDKSVMIEAFVAIISHLKNKTLYNEIQILQSLKVKIDDIADSYFLSQYENI